LPQSLNLPSLTSVWFLIGQAKSATAQGKLTAGRICPFQPRVEAAN
jgi:hypothetical protein